LDILDECVQGGFFTSQLSHHLSPFSQLPVLRLADAILARADEDSIDKELEEMDRQLKLQAET